MRRRQFVVQDQSSTQLDDRFIELTFAVISEPEIVIRLWELAVSLIDRGAQRDNRAVHIAQPVQSAPKISKSTRVGRLLLDRRSEFFGRVFEFSKIGERKPEI